MVGGEYQDFPSNISCLTEPKHFVEKPFFAGFQKIYDSKKFMDKREGEYQDFPTNFFVSQS